MAKASKKKLAKKKKPKKGFKDWYKDNGEGLNEKRRDRYHNDPAYRKKALAQAAATRAATGTATTEDGGIVRPILDEEGNPTGKTVVLYRIGTVATLLGRSIPGIRQWERQNKIPVPNIDGVHRVYSKAQLNLMMELSTFMEKNRYKRNVLDKKLQPLIDSIASKW